MRATTLKLWGKGTIKKAGAQVSHPLIYEF